MKTLWYLHQDASSNLSFPAPPDGNFTQNWCSQEHGASFPVASSEKLIFPGGAGHQYFSSLPQLPVAWLKFRTSTAERWRLSPSVQPPLRGLNAASENHGTLIALALHQTERSQPKRPGSTVVPSTKQSNSKVGRSLKGKCAIVPPPRDWGTEMWLRSKLGMEQTAQNQPLLHPPLPRQWADLFTRECGEVVVYGNCQNKCKF